MLCWMCVVRLSPNALHLLLRYRSRQSTSAIWLRECSGNECGGGQVRMGMGDVEVGVGTD